MIWIRAFAACCCFFLCMGPLKASASQGAVPWRALEPGLDIVQIPLTVSLQTPPPSDDEETPLPPTFKGVLTAIRIAPEQFSFSVYMASEKGPLPLSRLIEKENFVVAVNAGMYLPDNITNTGYLRSASHTNNKRVVASFGSFFVAEPHTSQLPSARLLDRNKDNWEKALEQYSLVMQNYRMTTDAGRVIWKQGERPHSIAALSQDSSGNILFLFCPDPVPAAEFIAEVLRLPLGAKSVMYLEGGIDAALCIRSSGMETIMTGRHASGLWSGGVNLQLPNVLGIRRKPKTSPSTSK